MATALADATITGNTSQAMSLFFQLSFAFFKVISEHSIFILIMQVDGWMDGWTVEETAGWDRDVADTQRDMQRQSQTSKLFTFLQSCFIFNSKT